MSGDKVIYIDFIFQYRNIWFYESIRYEFFLRREHFSVAKCNWCEN